MKVFTSLLVFALVAVAASSVDAARNEQKLKEGIARIDQSIADFQKQIADAKVKLGTASSAEKAKLNTLISRLSEQIPKLEKAKKQLEAQL